MSSSTRTAVGAVLSAVGAALLVATIGLFEIRSEAVAAGALIDWRNSLTGLADPGAPWVQFAASATLGLLALWLLTRSSAPGWAWFRLSVGLTIVVIVVIVIVTTEFPYSAVDPARAPADSSAFIEPLRAGALSPMTHLLGLSFIVLAAVQLMGRGREIPAVTDIADRA